MLILRQGGGVNDFLYQSLGLIGWRPSFDKNGYMVLLSRCLSAGVIT